MKPEFSEILLPHSKLQSESCNSSLHAQIVTNSVNTKVIKWLLGVSILFTLIIAIITTGFIFRYEDKMVQYEERIFSLETELESFFKKLAEDHQSFEEDELVFGTYPHHASLFEESDEETIELPAESESDSEPFGEIHVKESRSRSKRQIPISNAVTFGPEVERTGDGVPIIERSYLSSAGVTLRPRLLQVPTTDSEGLRLYEGLVETGGRNEPRSLDFARREGLDPLLPHHQVSAAWSEKAETRRPRIELKSGDSSSFGIHSTSGPQFANEVTYTRSTQRRASQSSGSSGSQYQQSGGSSNVLVGGGSSHQGATFHRNSRVPATGDFLYSNLKTTQARNIQYPPLRKLSVGNGEGEVIARVLQTDNESENDPNSAVASANNGQTATAEASSHRRRVGGYRRQRVQESESSPIATAYTRSHSSRRDGQKHSRRTNDVSDEDSGEISIVKAEAFVEGPKSVAAHYVADVSNFTTAHRNYEGNGRLRNADGIFAAWRPAEWMTADPSGDGTKSFVLSPNGVLNIKQSGLYYVYAQIHYLDEHDINGFTVQINTSPFLQCTTMTETYKAGSKSNSCFTAGVTHLKENDRIVIKDIETNRYSIFKPEKSFFGLMKIGG